MRILIVDDEATNRFLLKSHLAELGEADCAEDGEQAVEAVKRALKAGEPFDLICLDIEMPRKNGHQTLQELRQAERDHDIPFGEGAKVVMVSIVDDPQAIMEAFRGQCEGYIVKPLRKDKLYREIDKLGLLNPSPGKGATEEN